jgi:hypothetical protein
MFRYSAVLFLGLWAAGPAAAASWADAMFDELSKDFGTVPRGPTLSHNFRVTNNTRGTVHIANVRVSCGCVSAHALKDTLEPGEETAVVARMDTTRFVGVKSVTVYVLFDRPGYEEVRLWVQANGRNDFAVTPDGLAFGQVKRASAPSASVVVTFYGSPETQIVDARPESNYIQPRLREVKREGAEVAYELSARLRPDTPVGKWYTDVWVRTNNPAIPQVRVPLTVEVESPLTVSPEAVSLGQVAAGAEAERRVIVRGVKPFKITAVQGTDDHLAVRDSAADSKAVHVLTVRLKDAKPGGLSRTLRLKTDLPEEGEIEFHVSAQVTSSGF